MDRDWMGLWYRIAKERGDNDLASFGVVDKGSASVKWYDFSHAEMDGIGMFATLMESLGVKLNHLPANQRVARVPWLRKPQILVDALLRLGKSEIAWKHRSNLEREDQHDIAWHVFTSSETTAINQYCKRSGCSQNSLLLATFNRILQDDLTKDHTPGFWVFPVNLRGSVSKKDPKANHSSAVMLVADKEESAQSLHLQLKKQLSRHMHWGVWWIHHVGVVFGEKFMRFVSQRNATKSTCYGTFSNMGTWPIPGMDDRHISADSVFIATPPGSKSFPIGIVCLTWRGQLSVSLKVHPHVKGGRKGYEHSVIKRALEDLSFVWSSPAA